jgi:hypothetical protein
MKKLKISFYKSTSITKCLTRFLYFLFVLDFPFATIDVEVLNENLSCNFCYNLILVTMIIIVTFYAFFHSQGTLNHYCGCQIFCKYNKFILSPWLLWLFITLWYKTYNYNYDLGYPFSKKIEGYIITVRKRKLWEQNNCKNLVT